jgi:1-acyl-sn-glycerol-3-phosphate acyltransferase
MPKVVLHQWEMSPFCNKPRRCLRHKGVEYTVVNYNGLLAARASALSKVGKLPVLDWDAERIQDSSHIARFLDERIPQKPLYPRDAQALASARVWEDWAGQSLYFYEIYFRMLDPVSLERGLDLICEGRPRWERSVLKLIFKRRYPRKLREQGLARLAPAQVERQFFELVESLEAILQDRSALTGNEIGIADISVGAQLDELIRTSDLKHASWRIPGSRTGSSACQRPEDSSGVSRMSEKSQFALLKERRFAPFFWVQTLGAFNDNVFKNALGVLVAFGALSLTSAQVDFYQNLAAALFILPFFLFSATAGQLAERFEKSALIRGVKLLELAIAVLAALGLWLQSIPFLFAVLFLLGLQSTLFGPVKYSILPQVLRPDEIVGGNALVETATSLAILLGLMVGGILMGLTAGTTWVSGVVLAASVVGYLVSRKIPLAAATAPDLRINWNPITETWRNLRFMQGNRTVFLSVLGISWFWFYGATFITQLPNYTRVYLGGDERVFTLLLAVFCVGTGIGSLLCERLSGRKVEIGLVPLGSIGLTLFAIDLYFAQPGAATTANLSVSAFLAQPASHRVLWDLGLIGLFAGFYIVPLYALVQTRSEATHRSRIIAGNNILNALFMVASALVALALLGAGLSIPELLLTTALMNAAVAVFIYSLVPEFLMRFLVWVLINTLYRIRTQGLEHIPDEGPAVLACNHVSYVDALIIGGTVRRPVRFVMYHKIFDIPGLNFIFRTARAIPIAGAKENEALMNRAFEEVEKALAAGEVVGIFPEGGITRDGEIQVFRPGIERILQRSPVPVIPLALRGLWGSVFSRRDGYLKRMRLPRRFWSRIELVAATAVVPQEASAAHLEAKVRGLRGEAA